MGKMIVDFEWSPASMFVSCSVGLFCQFSSGSEDSILAADCHPRLAWVSSSLWLVYHCTTCVSAAAAELSSPRACLPGALVFVGLVWRFSTGQGSSISCCCPNDSSSWLMTEPLYSWCTYPCLHFQHWNLDSSSWLPTELHLLGALIVCRFSTGIGTAAADCQPSPASPASGPDESGSPDVRADLHACHHGLPGHSIQPAGLCLILQPASAAHCAAGVSFRSRCCPAGPGPTPRAWPCPAASLPDHLHACKWSDS